MSWGWILSGWLAGFALMLVELFVPGIIVGAVGALLTAAAVVAAFLYQGTEAGLGMLVGSLAFGGVLIKLGASRLTHRHQLDEAAGFVGTDDLSDLLGQHGVAATLLRPGGFATIDGKRVDVVARGEHLPKGTPVVVCGVSGNTVEVRQRDANEG